MTDATRPTDADPFVRGRHARVSARRIENQVTLLAALIALPGVLASFAAFVQLSSSARGVDPSSFLVLLLPLAGALAARSRVAARSVALIAVLAIATAFVYVVGYATASDAFDFGRRDGPSTGAIFERFLVGGLAVALPAWALVILVLAERRGVFARRGYDVAAGVIPPRSRPHARTTTATDGR